MSKFDELADSYSEVLQQNLRFIPGGVEYYTEYRAAITKNNEPKSSHPPKLLDFGCGTGASLEFLTEYFPNSEITGCDVSKESVRVAAARHPSVEFTEVEKLTPQSFDIIFVAGVMHHIQPSLRTQTFENLVNLLKPGGRLFIYELNPLNPVMRKLVSNCEFDEDAVLLTRASLLRTSKFADSISLISKGFTVFLPPLLGRFRVLERLIAWCPLGAQYFVVFEKTK